MDPVDEECISYSNPVGKLLLQINAISKKPALDYSLSELLDKLLNELQDADRYIANGIFFSNFPEAALFVQSSATLYSKKVDLLWDCMVEYQKRNLVLYGSDKEKKDNLEILEERKNKYKRKRKKIEQESDDKHRIFPVKQKATVSKLPSKEEPEYDDIMEFWDFDTNKCAIPNKDQPLEHTQCHFKFTDVGSFEDSMLLEDIDDNEFTANYRNILTHNLIKLQIEYNNNNLVPDRQDVIANHRIDFYVIYEFLQKKGIPIGTPREKYDADLRLYAQKYMNPQEHHVETMRRILCPAETVISLEPLPTDLVNDKLRRISLLETVKDDHKLQEKNSCCADELLKKGDNGNLSGDSLEKGETLKDDQIQQEKPGYCANALDDNRRLSLDSLDKEPKLSQESGIFDMDEFDDICPDGDNVCTAEDIFLDKDASNNVDKNGTNTADDSSVFDKDVTNLPKDTNSMEIVTINEKIKAFAKKLPITDFTLCFGGGSVVIPYNRKEREIKLKMRDSPMQTETTENGESPCKRRKLSQKAFETLCQSVVKPVKLGKWEHFHSINYLTEEGEGDIEPLSWDPSDFEDDCQSLVADTVSINNDDLPNITDITDETFPSSLTNTEETVTEPASTCLQATEDDIVDDGIELDEISFFESDEPNLPEASATKETTVQAYSIPRSETPQPSTSKQSDDSSIRQEMLKSKKNVAEWKSKITPVLRQLENAEFDIHAYGSKIMNSMQVNETKPFSLIVEGKSSSEVVRFFISSLQLANTYNIEISGNLKGQLSNNSMNLQLLQTERYHEHLQEYHAPSEESFRERLSRVQSMHSTPIGPPPRKKVKGDSKKCKLFQ